MTDLEEIDLASRAGKSALNIRNGRKLADKRLASMHKRPRWKRQLDWLKRKKWEEPYT